MVPLTFSSLDIVVEPVDNYKQELTITPVVTLTNTTILAYAENDTKVAYDSAAGTYTYTVWIYVQALTAPADGTYSVVLTIV